MQTGPSKNDVGPLETVALETNHQVALRAVEAALSYRLPPWILAPKLQSQSFTGQPGWEGAHLHTPAASTDESQIIPEHGTWRRHNNKDPHLTTLFPMPTSGCADLHRHCDSARLPSLAAPRSRRASKKPTGKKKFCPASLFARGEYLDIMRLSKL